MKKKQEQNFENVVDFSEYRKNTTKSKKPSAKINRESEHAAQELVYDAWDENNKRERIRLAKRALLIFPDCADAYNLLAEDAAKSPEEAREYYRKGMDAGRRAVGEKIFKEDSGYFWGMLETRPYMRARAGLMQCLWEEGNHNEAIGHARELLRLSTNDNQGIRYILIAYLAGLGRYDELESFMNGPAYKDDGMAEWLYTKALLLFVRTGDTPKARKALSTALKMNKHVPKYLTGEKKIPRLLPDSITVGGEDESYCYAAGNILAWNKAPGALDWLKEQAMRTGSDTKS
jgi:tetratricopeptide (TPR) repeat protein